MAIVPVAPPPFPAAPIAGADRPVTEPDESERAEELEGERDRREVSAARARARRQEAEAREKEREGRPGPRIDISV